MRKKAYAVRYVAGQPNEIIFAPENSDPLTYSLPEGARLPVYKTLKVLVWNIFKQQRADWQSVLLGLGKESHLILLQEAQTTPELIAYATKHHISVEQVPALQFPQHPSGVMTLSGTSAVFCCPLHEREPLLRMAKSALITVYPLPDGRMLMVVNIHAVNFSLGIDIYRKQLAAVGEQMRIHHGPVMMGGDFNSWSRQRMNVLYTFIRDQSLKEVRFSQDFRRTAFGRPLDFIFYRGMSIKNARILKTKASDHNPLFAEFSFTESR